MSRVGSKVRKTLTENRFVTLATLRLTVNALPFAPMFTTGFTERLGLTAGGRTPGGAWFRPVPSALASSRPKPPPPPTQNLLPHRVAAPPPPPVCSWCRTHY